MEKPPNQPMAASTSSLPAQTMDPTTLIDPTDTTLNAQSSRFELELEFIQSLANSDYLRFLAQNQFFQNEKFVRYLEYLQYWRDPKYARFLIYPYCLEILEFLQKKEFRDILASPDNTQFLHSKMIAYWTNWRKNNLSGEEKSNSTTTDVKQADSNQMEID